MTETATLTPAGERIRAYREANSGSYDGDPYRNEFWDDRNFYGWAERESVNDDGLTYIPSMARAIRDEAYEINEARPREWELNLMDAQVPPVPTIVQSPAVEWAVEDSEIHAAFPGPIPDDKLAKLRNLVRENKRLQADLTQAQAPISDSQDERLHPVLARAAVEADEQGYCSVYDQISNAVGFPDRNELRGLGAIEDPTWTGDLDVSFNVTVRVTLPASYNVSARNEDTATNEIRREYDNETERDTRDHFENSDISDAVAQQIENGSYEVGGFERSYYVESLEQN